MAPSRSYYCTDNGCFYDDGDSDEFFEVEEDDTEAATTPSEGGSFDFDLHLSSLADAGWRIDEIVGGVASRTVRATRTEHDGLGCVDGLGSLMKGRTSAVLKYAPPFLYKSPELKFDPYRQTIESTVLAALHDTTSPLYHVTQTTGQDISVPILIDHSSSENILIASDLGDLPTVETFLLSPHTTLKQASRAGNLLTKYLVELYRSVRFTSNQSDAVSQLQKSLLNSYIEPMMLNIIENSEEYMKMAGIRDYEVLGRRARDHWVNRNRSVFGHGDLCRGTILVNALDSSRLSLAICDWEFAGPNHPAADIAQLGAYLHLLTLSPLVSHEQCVAIYAFTDAFYASYFRSLDTIVDDEEEFQRSLLIMHAWRLIYVSSNQWTRGLWCTCTTDELNLCNHSMEMVQLGASMLRAAGDQEVHWKQLESLKWTRYFLLAEREQI